MNLLMHWYQTDFEKGERDLTKLTAEIAAKITAAGGKVDYVEAVDADELEPVTQYQGKPVMIDPGYYKNRRAGEFLTAIAGVTMNLILAVILSFPTKAVLNLYYASGSALAENTFYILYYAVMINVCLMIFNLIPVPPLDGWGILTQLFDLQKYSWWYKMYQYGQWILLILIFTNVTDLILGPAVSAIMRLLGL